MCCAIGHSFGDESLLEAALTHRSFRNERPKLAPSDNERLEFLGDAVLGAAVAVLLFEAYPDAQEGELTRKRADLVCESTLAAIARDLDVGTALRLGRGEDKSGGREKPRLLASAFEAIVGAVYVDGGREAAHALVTRMFHERLTGATARRDHKSRLQEIVQARGESAPRYTLVRAEGPDHERRFFVSVSAGGTSAEGEGRSKNEAEQAAACLALAQVEPEFAEQAKR